MALKEVYAQQASHICNDLHNAFLKPTTFLLFHQMCPYQPAEHNFQAVVAVAFVLISLSDRIVLQLFFNSFLLCLRMELETSSDKLLFSICSKEKI